MTLLNRKFRRDLLAIKGRILAIAFIIAGGVGIFHGIETALDDLRATQDNAIEQFELADIEVQTEPVNRDTIPDLQSLPGVRRAESRLLFPVSITLEDGTPLAGLAVGRRAEVTRLNLLDITSGRDHSSGEPEIVVERSLADLHGYAVGDRLTVSLAGIERDLTIVGIATSPEFLVTTSNPDYVIPEPGSLGVFWVDPGAVAPDLATTVNSLLIELDGSKPMDAVSTDVMTALDDQPVQRITPWDESYAYLSIRMDLNAFEVYSPAIVVTLVLLSIGLGILTVQRYAVEKRKEFGSLLAIGYSKRRLRRSLVVAGLLIGLLGGLLGVLVGSAVGWGFGEVYADAIKLSSVDHGFNPVLAVGSLALGVVAGTLSFAVGSWPILRTSTRLLLSTARPAPDQATGPTLGWLPISDRFAIRNLLRERISSIGAVVAVGASSAVAISYGLALSSTLGTVEDSFNRDEWTHAVDLVETVPTDQPPAFLDAPAVTETEPYQRVPGEIRKGDTAVVGVLVGLPASPRLRQVAPSEGRAARDDDEVVLSSDLARDLEIGIGDTVEVGEDGRSASLRVVGITHDIFLKTASLTLGSLADLQAGDEVASGYYLQADKGFGPELLGSTEGVARVVDKSQLVDHFREQIRETLGIVYITIAFSLAVSVLFIATLVYLSVAERRGEYANLRSLGFSRGKIRRIILTGAATQVLVGLAVAVPMSLGLALLLNLRMGTAWFEVGLHGRPMDFILPIVVGCVVAPVVALLGARSANRLEIATILRERV